ncbi:hypothetical protein EDB84DRAFT_1570969 [Lactarius hengduanensis]|nr:hypothetical protein EDB84DRAFT_1570969 [Lactarius hengduanensis]
MSQAPSTSTSSSNFQFIFNAALKAYEKKTKKDLLAHPLAAQLQACNSPADILVVLQDKVKELDQSRSADERLSRWLNPTIDVLYAFSATLGEGVGLVFSPAKVIFAGAGVLLLVSSLIGLRVEAILTMKSITGGPKMLVLVKTPSIDLFERIEYFFERLESYTSGNRPVVLPRQYVWQMEVDWLSLVDLWQTGLGKTVLCSAIVQDIVTLSEAGSASMAYFYFDFRDLDKQHIRNLLPSASHSTFRSV